MKKIQKVKLMQIDIKHIPCKPVSMRVSRMNNQLKLAFSAVITLAITGRLLFKLDAKKQQQTIRLITARMKG
jgi:hypothetical protein